MLPRPDRIAFSGILFGTVVLSVIAVACAQTGTENIPGLIDGLRRIDASRYGVTVLHPPGWKLTNLMRGDRAFALSLPEDHPSDPAGSVSCEIGAAPVSLVEYQKQAASDAEAGSGRKLESNQLLPVAAKGPEVPSLEIVWSSKRAGLGTWFEMKRYLIQNRQLYTFELSVDQGHFEAYRIEFERMVNTAKFRPPETGVVQIQGGYWMQRDFAFGMLLPRTWLPALGGSPGTVYFAAAPAEHVFADHVVVMARKLQPLDLEALQAQVPIQIRKSDPRSTIVRSGIVTLGKRRLLETVFRTRRGPHELTSLDLRFQGKRSNYEVRFTVLTEHFEKLADQLRDSADSFREFPLPGKGDAI